MAKNRKKIIINKFIDILLLISSGYLIYNIVLLGPIEPLIRYIIIGLIIIFNIMITAKIFLKKTKKGAFTLFILLLIIINIVISLSINKVYSTLSKISQNKTIYSTSLVTLKENKYNNISQIKNFKIGMLNDTKSIEGYELANTIIKNKKLSNNNTIKKYNSYTTLLDELYDKKLDAIFLPTNFENMFSNIDKYENINSDLKIIITETKKAKNSEKTYGTKKINEPFTMLLIGIDSSKEGLSNSDSFNGDSLMLVTFNPNTLNATILSIPRDSYVPIACFEGKYENKITHAAWKGTECIINTIQDFTDIKIDYYAKINFKGLVGLVNAVGGITVEVPKNLCTDSSDRKGKVCIKKGLQTLNGEQALVLARNRKQLANGDLDRGLNQQKVLQGILNSAKKINSVTEVSNILNVISDNLDMNMSEETILSFYDIGKNILSKAGDSSDLITLEQLYLTGTGQIIYDENTKLNLWNYILHEESVKDVTDEMKINLELKKYTPIKEFTFTIDSPYKKAIIGKGPYTYYTTYDLLPDFTKYTKSEALSWGSKNGVTIKFIEVLKNESRYYNGQIIKQDYPYKKRIDKISNKTITLTIVQKNTTESDTNNSEQNINE